MNFFIAFLMTRLLFAVALLLSIGIKLFAMPAFPEPIRVATVDGGETWILLHGNERCKYATNISDGRSVVCDQGVWKYLDKDSNNSVIVSDLRLKSNPSLEETFAIKKIATGLRPIANSERCPSQNVVRLNSGPVVGNRKVLIVLAEFPDKKFSRSQNDFDALLNQRGYSQGSAKGSVYDYFNEISQGQLQLECDVIGPFTSRLPYASYGGNSIAGGSDRNPIQLFTEALDYAKSVVNLREYDCDADGLLDNIHIIYAGYGEEAGGPADAIWAHECSFQPMTIMDGLKVDRYSCSSELRSNRGVEISPIGTICHEICHALGTPDFYDTDYATDGQYAGTGKWDLMANGSWNNNGDSPAWPNAYSRSVDFGWVEPIVNPGDGHYSLKKGEVVRLDTKDEGDYYLLEYRDKEGFSAHEPGKGMVIYHVGPDLEKRLEDNSINARYPQQCYVVASNATLARPNSTPTSYGNPDDATATFSGQQGNGSDSFSAMTTPGAFSVSGRKALFSISEISVADNSVNFDISWDSGFDPGTGITQGLGWNPDFSKSSFIEWAQTQVTGSASWTVVTPLISNNTEGPYLQLSIDRHTLSPRTVRTDLTSPLFKLNLKDIKPEEFDSLIVTLDLQNNSKEGANFRVSLAEDGRMTGSQEISATSKSRSKHSVIFDGDINYEALFELGIATEMVSRDQPVISIYSLSVIPRLKESQVDEIMGLESDNCYYDVQGCRISETDIKRLSPGIYIECKGGEKRKIIVK